jgi:carbon storage regulator
MLVLSRKKNEVIKIDDDVSITVVSIKGNTVRLGIEAPKEIRIIREEIEVEKNK